MSGLWEIEPNISSFSSLYHLCFLLATAKYTHELLLFHRQTSQFQRKLCFHEYNIWHCKFPWPRSIPVSERNKFVPHLLLWSAHLCGGVLLYHVTVYAPHRIFRKISGWIRLSCICSYPLLPTLSKNISRIIAQTCVIFPGSVKSWSCSAKTIYFFDILLYTVCMKWYNIVKF